MVNLSAYLGNYKFTLNSKNKDLVLSKEEEQEFINDWEEHDLDCEQAMKAGDVGGFYSKEHKCLVSGFRIG